MWGLKDRTSENTSQIKTARAGVDLADAVIARLDSQEDEIKQIVNRL